MKTVLTSPPVLDLHDWQPSATQRELALLLPADASCSTVLYQAADDEGQEFFRPRPVRDVLRTWPICLSECPSAPHDKLLASLGDWGLWRRRTTADTIPIIFADRAACDAEATSRTRNRR